METSSLSANACDEVDKAVVVVPDDAEVDSIRIRRDVGMTSITSRASEEEEEEAKQVINVDNGEGGSAGGSSLSTNNQEGSASSGVDVIVVSVENGDLQLQEPVVDKPEAESQPEADKDGTGGVQADGNDINGSAGCVTENRHSWHLDKSMNK